MSDKLILVVDDDAADVYFLTRAFRETLPDIRVHAIADGIQAIDYLAGNGNYADRAAWPFPSHLFLDLKIPLKSGIEVLQWLRRQPAEVGQLPVTVLSGSKLAEDIDRVRALGAEYMVKPLEYSALLRLVHEFAQRFTAL